MSDLNRAVIVGRLTKDSDLSYTATGTPLSKFSIANNETYRDKSTGTNKKITNFFNVVVWGKIGETLHPFLKKGKLVGIDGRLKQERWNTQDGQTRSAVNIVTENIQIMPDGSGKKNEGEPSGPNNIPNNQETFEDDIPF